MEGISSILSSTNDDTESLRKTLRVNLDSGRNNNIELRRSLMSPQTTNQAHEFKSYNPSCNISPRQFMKSQNQARNLGGRIRNKAW